ncbi:hypothetical protein LZ30DRAFT_611134 [Colletotrichum cereale]|nr:hypothetical protein LZ30DRAFT_611134 [Colletotrichum cereale]
MPHFFRLPREIRDIIYRQYVLCEGGYVLNPHTNKLTSGSNNQPIDLSLMSTCKRVAAEMKHMALAVNILTFSTFYSPEERIRAGIFHLAHNELALYLKLKLIDLPQRLLSDDMYAEISAAYPQFTTFLDSIRDGSYAILYVPLGTGAFCGDRELSRDPRLAEALIYRPVPWAIPDQHDLDKITDLFSRSGDLRLPCNRAWNGHERTKFRYSAAAVAIRFLKSLPPTTRAQIKTMVLLEDREAVENPECHALGLIPFCQENPSLRVERRVSLWKNAFLYSSLHQTSLYRLQDGFRGLEANEVSAGLARWIMEALTLVPAGMPPGSFTLVLDGEQDPTCEEIFQSVVLRDAVWQQAMDESFARGYLPPTPFVKRREDHRSRNYFYIGAESFCNHSYVCERFPQAVADIVNGTSIVRCSFNPGELSDVEQLVEERKSWTLADWKTKWFARDTPTFRPSPGFTPWKKILRECVVPKRDAY